MQAWACLRRVYNKRDSIVSKSNLVEHCPWNLFFSSRSRMSYRGIARYNTEFLSYITRLNNKRLIDREDFWKRRERERDSGNCKLNESRWKRTFKKKNLTTLPLEFWEASYTLSPKRKFTLCFQLQQGACLHKPMVYLGHGDGKFTIPNSGVRCISFPFLVPNHRQPLRIPTAFRLKKI